MGVESYKNGGFHHKYNITKRSGEPNDPDAKYFVLRVDKDPHAQHALAAYATSVRRDNPELADDLVDLLMSLEEEPIEESPKKVDIEEYRLKAPFPGALVFTKEYDSVKLPTKRDEDAGYDIYTVEEEAIIAPGETYIFRTGLRSRIPGGFWAHVRERGSTGKIGLSVRAGVVDSGYRGEWMILLNNTSDKTLVVSSKERFKEIQEHHGLPGLSFVHYDNQKAIAQAVLQPVVNVPEVEVDGDFFDKYYAEDSERGDGKFGSSNK